MGSTKTENESNTLSGSVINSAQPSGKKNNWKCDSQELFASLFKEKVLHGNGLILKFILLCVRIFDAIEFLLFTHVMK